MARATYHHGNLRQELIDAAIVKLEADGLAALSLRQLAIQLGVASSAPYRHFASRDELLHAVVLTVSDEIRRGFKRFVDLDAPPRERALGGFRWYLDFARQRPEFYRLVFAHDREWHIDIAAEARTEESFGVFSELIAGVSGLHDARELHHRAVTIWSMLHGFALLRMNANIDRNGFISSSESALIEDALRIALPY